MKRSMIPLLCILALGLGGCYTATVNTGATPGAMVVKQDWASAWLAGLVPPSDVNTMQACPSGVAQVRTSLSFLNQLAAAFTAGIYTPMTIHVVCAAGQEQAAEGGSSALALDATDATRRLEAGESFLLPLR